MAKQMQKTKTTKHKNVRAFASSITGNIKLKNHPVTKRKRTDLFLNLLRQKAKQERNERERYSTNLK